MYKYLNKILVLVIILLTCVILIVNCGKDEPTRPASINIPVETTIVAGPADGETLVWGATATFTWKGEISPGDIIAFEYSLISTVNGETSSRTATSLQRSISYSELSEGSYEFRVTAIAIVEEDTIFDSSPAVRTFTVGTASQMPPAIEITAGPREKSFAATGADIFISWIGSAQEGRQVITYSFRLNTSTAEAAWSDWAHAQTNIAYSSLPNAKYTFEVKVRDNTGQESTTKQLHFEIKTPDVLFIVDQANSSEDIVYWKKNCLRDFACEQYLLSSNNQAGELVSKINSGQYSTIVWSGGTGKSVLTGAEASGDTTATGDGPIVSGTVAHTITTFLNNGGHIWICGADILYSFGNDTWPPATYSAGSFVHDVLHISSSNEDDANFQGGQGELGYPDFIVDGNATFAWCDQCDPTADAEAIYLFNSPVPDFDGQSVSVRYPAGATNPGDTQVVFSGFYLTDSSQPAAIKISDAYNLASKIFDDFGENMDW
ncbi:hypothetical protein JW960_12400 [candidate division KSB1 bacterium]|nr:hypothetical protein [candidate division KSB1 bacterium]